MDRLKRWIVRACLWVASLTGWVMPTYWDQAQLEDARTVVKDVATRFPEFRGEQKRREAQRVLMNIWPHADAKTINLAIELALR